ncbi:MAG: hypothetical protein GX410_01990 [Elusimicrobia bacterium]|nr:hypothetical protein [Elusimicrobiota bacterium]
MKKGFTGVFLALFLCCGNCLAQSLPDGLENPLDNSLPELNGKTDKLLISGGDKAYKILNRMFMQGQKPDLEDISGVYLGHMLDKTGQHWYRILPVFAADGTVIFLPNASYPRDHSPYRDRNHVRMSFIELASWVSSQPVSSLKAVSEPAGYRHEVVPSELRQYKNYLLVKYSDTKEISCYSRKLKVLSPGNEASLKSMQAALLEQASKAGYKSGKK